MIVYNIHTNGPSSQLVIELINDGVYVEPRAVAYVVGNIKLDASVGTLKDKIKAHFIGKKYFRPIFKGTGKIYLKATIGSYHKFSVNEQDKLIIANSAFIACRDAIEIIPQINASLNKFLSGAPIITNLVRGTGNVVIQMPGPVIEEKLTDSTFVAYNTNIAAYSSTLQVTRDTAGKGWLNIANKTVHKYKGTGSIFFTPNPNKDAKPI